MLTASMLRMEKVIDRMTIPVSKFTFSTPNGPIEGELHTEMKRTGITGFEVTLTWSNADEIPKQQRVYVCAKRRAVSKSFQSFVSFFRGGSSNQNKRALIASTGIGTTADWELTISTPINCIDATFQEPEGIVIYTLEVSTPDYTTHTDNVISKSSFKTTIIDTVLKKEYPGLDHSIRLIYTYMYQFKTIIHESVLRIPFTSVHTTGHHTDTPYTKISFDCSETLYARTEDKIREGNKYTIAFINLRPTRGTAFGQKEKKDIVVKILTHQCITEITNIPNSIHPDDAITLEFVISALIEFCLGVDNMEPIEISDASPTKLTFKYNKAQIRRLQSFDADIRNIYNIL